MRECSAPFNSIHALEKFLCMIDRKIDNANKNLAAQSTPGHTKTILNFAPNSDDCCNAAVSQVANEKLAEQMRQADANKGYFCTLNQYLGYLEDLLNPHGNFAQSGTLMKGAIRKAEINPDVPNKLAAVNAIDRHVSDLNKLANKSQKIRWEIDQDLSNTLERINTLTANIANYNAEIIAAGDGSVAQMGLLDSRRQALLELSSFIGINITEFGQNQIKVTTDSNITLVQGVASTTLNYTPSIVVGPNTVFGGITATGFGGSIDVTNLMAQSGQNGKIPALMWLRDNIFPGLCQQLDTYAANLRDDFNTMHNQGTGMRPPNTLVGHIGMPNTAGALTNTTAVSGNGIVRIGVLNPATSKIISHIEIDLSTITNVGNIINAINTSGINPPITASITTTGALQLNTALSNGIAVGNVGNAAKLSVGAVYDAANAYDFSAFFGLNDLLVSPNGVLGLSTAGLAQELTVRQDIKSSGGEALAAGKLSNALNLPSTGLTSPVDLGARDSSILTNLSKDYDQANHNFAATLISTAKTTNLQKYAADIISAITQQIKDTGQKGKDASYLSEVFASQFEKESSSDPEEILQEIYNLALSKRMGLKVLALLQKIHADSTDILLGP